MSIVIIDHGLANVYSIVNMLKHLNCYPEVCNNYKTLNLKESDKIILPGIGFASSVWNNLEKLKIIEPLRELVEVKKKPILGICVGMQLMSNGSEEGNSPGFGWVKGKCIRFHFSKENNLKIPHMSWNEITPQSNSKLFNSLMERQKFYFVHSYYMECKNPKEIAATCHYGHDFVAAIEKDNVFGVQFHPEKSHKYGMQLFKSFMSI